MTAAAEPNPALPPQFFPQPERPAAERTKAKIRMRPRNVYGLRRAAAKHGLQQQMETGYRAKVFSQGDGGPFRRPP